MKNTVNMSPCSFHLGSGLKNLIIIVLFVINVTQQSVRVAVIGSTCTNDSGVQILPEPQIEKTGMECLVVPETDTDIVHNLYKRNFLINQATFASKPSSCILS